jgi:response regulator RpfG family c-di-GMP phosphodiesterase
MSRSILMLEHDDDDRYITQSVFKDHHYDIRIHFVNTSVDVFGYLDQCAKNSQQLPSLILLNYHASPSNAVEIVNDLKAGDKFSHIPVVVLSGSVKSEIIRECYLAGANSFIQKPSSADDTEKKISNFFRYWFETVELP